MRIQFIRTGGSSGRGKNSFDVKFRCRYPTIVFRNIYTFLVFAESVATIFTLFVAVDA